MNGEGRAFIDLVKRIAHHIVSKLYNKEIAQTSRCTR